MDCIEWTKCKDRDGYGLLRLKGKTLKAHRKAYCDANNLPYDSIRGKVVRHKCDNPSCVNPAHLELGTQLDNIQDRCKRKRSHKPLGTLHANVVLTEAIVLQIRSDYVPQCKTNGCTALALRYGVEKSAISKIINRRTWTHI